MVIEIVNLVGERQDLVTTDSQGDPQHPDIASTKRASRSPDTNSDRLDDETLPTLIKSRSQAIRSKLG